MRTMRRGQATFAALVITLLGHGVVDPASAADAPPGPINAQLPTFPQTFDVQGPIANSFGFAVTQPGLIVVDVQGKGAPLSVVLQGPAAQPIAQQGAGLIRLSYTVTPQDLRMGFLWNVQIRLTNPAVSGQGGRASGSINIQFPPVDQAALQKAVQSMAAQIKAPSEQEQNQGRAQAASRMQATFDQQRTQFDQQQAERRATLNAQIRPQLDQLRSRMGPQVRSRGLRGEAAISAPLQPLDTTTMQRMPPPAVPAEPATASSSQALQSAGSTPGPQTVMPNPAISSLNIGQGQPGDPVMINGSGFGNGGGEVHFVIAPDRDVIVPAGVIWNDTQIFASVPDATGVRGFNGMLYVKRPDKTSSNLVPFRFNPLLEIRQITRAADVRLQQFDGVSAQVYDGNGYSYPYGTFTGRTHSFLFWSPQGNDYIFQTTRLKNGWTVSQPPVAFTPFAGSMHGGVYVAESRVGTDQPYMNVRFWMGSGLSSFLSYSISAIIQGPKGMPDGVVIP